MREREGSHDVDHVDIESGYGRYIAIKIMSSGNPQPGGRLRAREGGHDGDEEDGHLASEKE